MFRSTYPDKTCFYDNNVDKADQGNLLSTSYQPQHDGRTEKKHNALKRESIKKWQNLTEDGPEFTSVFAGLNTDLYIDHNKTTGFRPTTQQQ